MKVLETGAWSLLLPPEWEAERDEDSVLIADRDGVGCLEISELRKESGNFSESDLDALGLDASLAWKPVRIGPLAGLCAALVEDDAAIREWYLYAGAMLLYITYSCDLENQGMDDAAVDEILATLSIDLGADPAS